MPEYKNDLEFYDAFFDTIPSVQKIKGFVFDEETRKYQGIISLKARKSDLVFEVQIPEGYPFSETRFIAESFSGFPHQNLDGTLCLNTGFVNHIYTRLHLEVEKLKGYVKKYYDNGETDNHYEYIPGHTQDWAMLLFQEQDYAPSRFAQSPYGEFTYSVLNYTPNEKKDISFVTAYAQNLGNLETPWAAHYKNQPKYRGVWVFLEQEPVVARKQRITEWQDLIPLLPPGFSDYFEGFCKRTAQYKLGPGSSNKYILLPVGYKIPNHKGGEVHWDLVLVPRTDFPKNSKKGYSLKYYDKPILWDNTKNSSYERFFGRGSCAGRLRKAKILVLGNGAIGSSLCEIMVRSGITSLSITDQDMVEPGNICRSTFGFDQVTNAKSEALKKKLESISPFVDVKALTPFQAASPKEPGYKEIMTLLSSYDLIFDCTASNEIIQMLSDMSLKQEVFYISMTDKARQMICVSNSDSTNMLERRNAMLYAFGNFREAQFREGTGCWHPTFEASCFDLNQLLNATVRKLNTYYRLKQKPRSFYTYTQDDEVRISEDVRFLQKDLNLTLTIESRCLDKIEHRCREHYPKEFGGVLVGSYLNNYQEVVISDILVPTRFRNGATHFTPDHHELNRLLHEHYDRYDGRLEYIGDWHSHPNGSNHYSSTDFHSIRDVALSKSVNTHNPVLLIAAYGKDYFEPGFYVFHNQKLHKYERCK